VLVVIGAGDSGARLVKELRIRQPTWSNPLQVWMTIPASKESRFRVPVGWGRERSRGGWNVGAHAARVLIACQRHATAEEPHLAGLSPSQLPCELAQR